MRHACFTTWIGRTLLLLALAGTWLAPRSEAAIFSDDFDDGDIAGWTTYNPLSIIGGSFSTSFLVPGKVQLQSDVAPIATFPNYGPGRGAIYRNDFPQTGDHRVSAEFSSYEINNQFFGVTARTRQYGLGTLDGYVLSYSPQWYTGTPRARFAIDRLDNEITRIELAEFRFDELLETGTYKLELTLQGSLLTGVLTNVLDPLNPISTISATDSNYSQGLAGLFVAGSLINNTTALVNFDNFAIESIPEPSTWALLLAAGLGCLAVKRQRGRTAS